MRGLSCAARNEAVLSMSITATMCCRQISGISRLSTTRASVLARRTTTGLHVVGIHGPLFQNVVHGVERRLDRRTHGPFLDVGPAQSRSARRAANQLLRIGIGRVRQEIIVDARKNVVEAVKSRMNHQGGGHSVARVMPAKTKAFSMCSVSRFHAPMPEDCWAV